MKKTILIVIAILVLLVILLDESTAYKKGSDVDLLFTDMKRIRESMQ